jgi:hypothetical protein
LTVFKVFLQSKQPTTSNSQKIIHRFQIKLFKNLFDGRKQKGKPHEQMNVLPAFFRLISFCRNLWIENQLSICVDICGLILSVSYLQQQLAQDKKKKDLREGLARAQN